MVYKTKIPLLLILFYIKDIPITSIQDIGKNGNIFCGLLGNIFDILNKIFNVKILPLIIFKVAKFIVFSSDNSIIIFRKIKFPESRYILFLIFQHSLIYRIFVGGIG